LTESQKIYITLILSGLFLALSAVLIATEHFWYTAIVPVVAILVWLYVYKLDKVILLTAFLTPVAVNLDVMDMGVSISLPTEPLMFGILLLFLLKALFDNQYDKRIFSHPVSVIIMIQLFWMLITSITSEYPLVSLKYFVSRLWFVVPFYFMGIMLFKKLKNANTFIWVYVVPLLFVVGFASYVLASHGFDEDVSHWAMSPFYNDHTAYGAILALLLPFTIGFTFFKKYSFNYRLLSGFVSVILLAALYLSNSRAAWVSFVIAFLVLLVILFRIKFRYIFLGLAVLVGLFFTYRVQIIDYLEKNDQDSSANFQEHLQSIYNISTDASNLERINRWQSALRMFKERPVTGWGPGTYQFVYAPFQRSKEKTIISTNFGDMGNAHSEFLGPLSESGAIGMLIVITLVVVILNRGLRVFNQTKDPETKMLAMAALLSLITYYTHGTLNNFLDTDKLSVPVWAITGLIVALDIYHSKKANGSVVQNEKESPASDTDES
jgi:oligosaccharide repeat unit polymerase